MSDIKLKELTFYCTNESCGDPVHTPILMGNATNYKKRKMVLIYRSWFSWKAAFQCPVCSEQLNLKRRWFGSGFKEICRIPGKLMRLVSSKPPAKIIPYGKTGDEER